MDMKREFNMLLFSAFLIYSARAAADEDFAVLPETPRLVEVVSSGPDGRAFANKFDGFKIYPWTNGVVSYFVDQSFAPYKSGLEAVLREIESLVPCLKFKERATGVSGKDYYYMRFQYTTCGSYMGEPIHGQPVKVSFKCIEDAPLKYGYLYHEILHGLGRMHEHQRPDRDDFIQVKMDNVCVSKNQLTKNPWSLVNGGPICHSVLDQDSRRKRVLSELLPFDLESVMCYAAYANSCKYLEKQTIVPLNMTGVRTDSAGRPLFGQPNLSEPDRKMSPGDIANTRYYYGCNQEINRKYFHSVKGCREFKLSFKAGSTIHQLYQPFMAGTYRMDGQTFLDLKTNSTGKLWAVYRMTTQWKAYCALVEEPAGMERDWACTHQSRGRVPGKRDAHLFFRRTETPEAWAFNYGHRSNGLGWWIKVDNYEDGTGDMTVACTDKPAGYQGPIFHVP